MNRRRVGAASVDGVAEDRRPRSLVLSVNLSRKSSCFQYFYVDQTAREGRERGGRVTGLHTVEAVSRGRFGSSKRRSCYQYIYLAGSFGWCAAIASSNWVPATSTRSSAAV